MSLTVRCERCGSAYETEAPLEAIREVNRCRECGGGALVIDREDESFPQRTPAVPSGEPRPGDPRGA